MEVWQSDSSAICLAVVLVCAVIIIDLQVKHETDPTSLNVWKLSLPACSRFFVFHSVWGILFFTTIVTLSFSPSRYRSPCEMSVFFFNPPVLCWAQGQSPAQPSARQHSATLAPCRLAWKSKRCYPLWNVYGLLSLSSLELLIKSSLQGYGTPIS